MNIEIDSAIMRAVLWQRRINNGPISTGRVKCAFEDAYGAYGVELFNELCNEHNGYIDKWFISLTRDDKNIFLNHNAFEIP